MESSKRDVDRYLKEKVTDLQQKLSSTVSEMQAEAADFNSCVASTGLLVAAKHKINQVRF